MEHPRNFGMDIPLVLLGTLGSDTWLLVPWVSVGTLGSFAWSLVSLYHPRKCCMVLGIIVSPWEVLHGPWYHFITLGRYAGFLLWRFLQLCECCVCDVQVGDVRDVGAVIGCMYVSLDRMDICIPLFVVVVASSGESVLWGDRIQSCPLGNPVLVSQKWASPLIVQVWFLGCLWAPSELLQGFSWLGPLELLGGWHEEVGKIRTCVVVESRPGWHECS